MITPEIIAEYAANGAICMRGLFSSDWLDLLARGVDRNFENPGPHATRYTDPGQPGGFYDDYCNWQRIPEYRTFMENSPAAEIAGRLMHSETARIYHEHVLVKEPGTREATPWHHDMPYYGVTGEQTCSIWLPLDPVPQAICPQFVAGSHMSGKMYYPRLFINSENYGDEQEGFEQVPDIESMRKDLEILSWDLQPGDCIVFHMRTLHGAPPTVGVETRRRGFSTRWTGDDARIAERPWKTSPPFPEVDLKAGDRLEHASFPVLWSS